jgi:hypothetical protein
LWNLLQGLYYPAGIAIKDDCIGLSARSLGHLAVQINFALRVKIMNTVHAVVLGSLLILAGGSARAQILDQVDTLPVSIQARIGTTTEIKCQEAQSIPFTPVSGSTTQLKCGDWFTILGAHGSSYVVRAENGSVGYLLATALPTDPCAQTNFRVAWFDRQWMPKFKSMSKEEANKFIKELYLKATSEDISVAYSCASQAMSEQNDLGGLNGYLSNFDLSQRSQTYSSDEKNKMMDFAAALNDEITALRFIGYIKDAWRADDGQKYSELGDRYNALVDKYNNLSSFVDQRMRDLNSVSPPATAQTQTPTWRRILAGTLQGIASYTPPKHIVCDTNGDISLFGDATQPGYIYMNGNLNSHTDCREQ